MYPKINDIMYVLVDSGDEKEAAIEYKSKLCDMDEDSMLIEIPMQEISGKLKHLYIGDELSIYFLSEGGVKNYFNTYVLGHKEDVIRMVRLRKPDPDSISKVQRRSFLRVLADLEVAVRLKDGTRMITRTDDVSGGGVSVYSDHQYGIQSGDRISCWLLVPYKNGSVEHVPFEGEVIRVKEADKNRSLSMVKFTSISDMERQKVIKYCFERQFDFRNR